jgi:hypothetical protein
VAVGRHAVGLVEAYKNKMANGAHIVRSRQQNAHQSSGQRGWRQSPWFLFVIAITLLTVVATVLAPELKMLKGIGQSGENSFGPWWSAMLLFIVGLHAFDGYATRRPTPRITAIGWLCLSIIAVILSADEAGSMHERVADFGESLGYSMFVSWFPFALVLMGLLGVCLYGLTRSCETRSTTLLVVLAFFLLGTVPLQEYIEHNIGAWRVRGMEEGTEMLGILLLFYAAMRNTRGAFSGEPGQGPVFDLTFQYYRTVTIVALISLPLVAYLAAYVIVQDNRGQVANWLGAILFLMAGFAILRQSFLIGRWNHKIAIVAALLFFASFACIGVRINYAISLPDMQFSNTGDGLSLRLMVLATVAMLFALVKLEIRPGWIRLIAVVPCVLAMAMPGRFSVYAATIASAAISYWLAGRYAELQAGQVPRSAG